MPVAGALVLQAVGLASLRRPNAPQHPTSGTARPGIHCVGARAPAPGGHLPTEIDVEEGLAPLSGRRTRTARFFNRLPAAGGCAGELWGAPQARRSSAAPPYWI